MRREREGNGLKDQRANILKPKCQNSAWLGWCAERGEGRASGFERKGKGEKEGTRESRMGKERT